MQKRIYTNFFSGAIFGVVLHGCVRRSLVTQEENQDMNAKKVVGHSPLIDIGGHKPARDIPNGDGITGGHKPTIGAGSGD